MYARFLAIENRLDDANFLLGARQTGKSTRTYTGIEVDAIIGDARVAIEIKSAEEIKPRHKKNLKIFAQEHPNARKIIVSLDRMTRESEGIELLYVIDFLRMLWAGEIITN